MEGIAGRSVTRIRKKAAPAGDPVAASASTCHDVIDGELIDDSFVIVLLKMRITLCKSTLRMRAADL